MVGNTGRPHFHTHTPMLIQHVNVMISRLEQNPTQINLDPIPGQCYDNSMNQGGEIDINMIHRYTHLDNSLISSLKIREERSMMVNLLNK